MIDIESDFKSVRQKYPSTSLSVRSLRSYKKSLTKSDLAELTSRFEDELADPMSTVSETTRRLSAELNQTFMTIGSMGQRGAVSEAERDTFLEEIARLVFKFSLLTEEKYREVVERLINTKMLYDFPVDLSRHLPLHGDLIEIARQRLDHARQRGWKFHSIDFTADEEKLLCDFFHCTNYMVLYEISCGVEALARCMGETRPLADLLAQKIETLGSRGLSVMRESTVKLYQERLAKQFGSIIVPIFEKKRDYVLSPKSHSKPVDGEDKVRISHVSSPEYQYTGNRYSGKTPWHFLRSLAFGDDGKMAGSFILLVPVLSDQLWGTGDFEYNCTTEKCGVSTCKLTDELKTRPGAKLLTNTMPQTNLYNNLHQIESGATL